MKTEKYMDQELLIKKALGALIKELGPIETLRFLNLPKEKRLESVQRHHLWQKGLNKEKFLNELFAIS
jgi:hypothetical protein